MSDHATPAGLAGAVRLGLTVTAALTVLTIVEYLVAVNLANPLLFLLPFVVAKGWLILDFFMHIRALREGEH